MNVGRGIAAGLVASMVMGMMQMGYEMVAGSGLWAPMVFIAATLLRDLQTVPTPVPFLPLPVVLGLMGHMMNSVIFAFLFAWLLASRLHGLGTLAFGGMAYSVVILAVMWFGIAPLVDPAMLRANGVVFFIAHLMWGAALGLVLGWGQQRETTPRFSAQHAR